VPRAAPAQRRGRAGRAHPQGTPARGHSRGAGGARRAGGWAGARHAAVGRPCAAVDRAGVRASAVGERGAGVPARDLRGGRSGGLDRGDCGRVRAAGVPSAGAARGGGGRVGDGRRGARGRQGVRGLAHRAPRPDIERLPRIRRGRSAAARPLGCRGGGRPGCVGGGGARELCESDLGGARALLGTPPAAQSGDDAGRARGRHAGAAAAATAGAPAAVWGADLVRRGAGAPQGGGRRVVGLQPLAAAPWAGRRPPRAGGRTGAQGDAGVFGGQAGGRQGTCGGGAGRGGEPSGAAGRRAHPGAGGRRAPGRSAAALRLLSALRVVRVLRLSKGRCGRAPTG